MRIWHVALAAFALNGNLLVAAQSATKTGAASKGSLMPGSTYDQMVLEVMAKNPGLKTSGRLRPNWDKEASCEDKKCKGNQVTDRKDPEKCRECPKGQKPNPENTKCIRDDTGCADDEYQKDDKTCDKCPGTQIADSTGKKCIDLATCAGNQANDPDDNSKCKDCPAGQKPSPDNSRCLREDTGCADDEYQKDDKTCERCGDNKKGDKDGKTCVDKNKSSSGKQGKCPNGQVLNPAKGGQDENTENPSCIPDDDLQCEDGKKAGTRSKKNASDANMKPTCGVEENPDFSCSDSKLYDHKKVNDDGKIEHSCRSTEKTEDEKKKKYDERIKNSKNPGTQTPESKEKDDKNKKRRRARGGWCFIELAQMGIWDSPELADMSEDEIDGLVELAVNEVPTPEGDFGDGSIPDFMIEIKQPENTAHVVIDGSNSETAGGGPLAAILGVVNAVAKSVPKVIQNAAQGAGKVIKQFKTGARGTPAAKAISAAKNSKIVDRVLKSQEFRECAASVALTGVEAAFGNFEIKGANEMAGYSLKVDWSRKDPGDVLAPEGQEMITLYAREHDAWTPGANAEIVKETKTSKRITGRDMLPYEKCDEEKPRDMPGRISQVEVRNGCCAFYSGNHCQGQTHLFDMDRRRDPKLTGNSNDNIRSWWCSKDCANRPIGDHDGKDYVMIE